MWLRRELRFGVAALGLAAATAAYFYSGVGGGDEAIPNTDESATQWLCRACGFDVRMTARRAAEAAERAGGVMPLICQKCGKKELWRAAYCEKHHRLYLTADAPGSRGICPLCQPPATQRRKDGAEAPASAHGRAPESAIEERMPTAPNM